MVNQPLSLFVNVANGDLHLNASESVAIDQASVIAGVADDFDGLVRPVGPAPDVGADEYGSSSGNPTPTPIPNFEVNARIFLPIAMR